MEFSSFYFKISQIFPIFKDRIELCFWIFSENSTVKQFTGVAYKSNCEILILISIYICNFENKKIIIFLINMWCC